MSEKQKYGIGSTIITKDGKYTFVIHPTTEAAKDLPPIVCPVWYDTVEKAKKEGSRFLTESFSNFTKETGVVVDRYGDEHHIHCRSYPDCHEDLEGCLLHRQVTAVLTEKKSKSKLVIPITQFEFVATTGSDGVSGIHSSKEWWAGKGRMGVVVLDLVDDDWSWVLLCKEEDLWSLHSQGINFPSIDDARSRLMEAFSFPDEDKKTVLYETEET